jgi:hypothetical protein
VHHVAAQQSETLFQIERRLDEAVDDGIFDVRRVGIDDVNQFVGFAFLDVSPIFAVR